MIKAMVRINGGEKVSFFDTIGEAMKWLRSFSLTFEVDGFSITNKDGSIYYKY